MARTPNFFEYGRSTPPSQKLSYRRAQLVPENLQTGLRQINVTSIQGFNEFLTSNPKHEEFFLASSGLYEDELARLKHRVTQQLEAEKLIDDRCGNKRDACRPISKKFIELQRER